MPNHCSLFLFLYLDVAVGILARKVVHSRDFILCAVATFWAMSLVGFYPGRAESNGANELHVVPTRCPSLEDEREVRATAW